MCYSGCRFENSMGECRRPTKFKNKPCPHEIDQECGYCNGTGLQGEETCEMCNGTGIAVE